VRGLDGILDEPAPTVVVEACGASSVDLQLRVWIADTGRRQPVYFVALEAGKRALDAAGIQIPYPHLQVFWDDVEQRVVDKLGTLGRGEPAA
jgi:small conductance mechanosensitive channel